MEWEHVDWQLFQDISPISVHCDEDLSSFCVEPISYSSSSHAWIGAQPHSPAKTNPQHNSAYEATIADTVLDSESSKVSTTQTWTQHSAQQKPTQKRKRSDCSQEYDSSDALTLQARHGSSDYFRAQEDRLHGSRPSCDYPSPDENADRLANRGFGFSQEQDLQASRTRDTNDWASSIFDFLSGLFLDTLQYSTQLYEEDPIHTTDDSEFSSLQRFMQEHGPYPGWEYDEYYGEPYDPTTPGMSQTNVLLPVVGSGSEDNDDADSSSSQGPRWRDTWPSNFSPLAHAPSSPFWLTRSIDSLGSIRHIGDRDQIPDSEAAATLTPESQRVPTPLRWQWYRSPDDDDDRDEDIQSSQQHIESIFDSIYGEEAFLPISPRRENGGTETLQGGGKEDFQPNKTDINKLVQKLKCIQHGYQPKQMRMLLVADSKFMRKIERTTDAKQLQDCVRAAAQRMGLVLPTPAQPDANNQATHQNHKNPI